MVKYVQLLLVAGLGASCYGDAVRGSIANPVSAAWEFTGIAPFCDVPCATIQQYREIGEQLGCRLVGKHTLESLPGMSCQMSRCLLPREYQACKDAGFNPAPAVQRSLDSAVGRRRRLGAQKMKKLAEIKKRRSLRFANEDIVGCPYADGADHYDQCGNYCTPGVDCICPDPRFPTLHPEIMCYYGRGILQNRFQFTSTEMRTNPSCEAVQHCGHNTCDDRDNGSHDSSVIIGSQADFCGNTNTENVNFYEWAKVYVPFADDEYDTSWLVVYDFEPTDKLFFFAEREGTDDCHSDLVQYLWNAELDPLAEQEATADGSAYPTSNAADDYDRLDELYAYQSLSRGLTAADDVLPPPSNCDPDTVCHSDPFTIYPFQQYIDEFIDSNHEDFRGYTTDNHEAYYNHMASFPPDFGGATYDFLRYTYDFQSQAYTFPKVVAIETQLYETRLPEESGGFTGDPTAFEVFDHQEECYTHDPISEAEAGGDASRSTSDYYVYCRIENAAGESRPCPFQSGSGNSGNDSIE